MSKCIRIGNTTVDDYSYTMNNDMSKTRTEKDNGVVTDDKVTFSICLKR